MIPLETIDPVAATGLFSYAWLMIALPALGAFVLLGFGRYVEKSGPYLAVATIGGPVILGLAIAYGVVQRRRRRRVPGHE